MKIFFEHWMRPILVEWAEPSLVVALFAALVATIMLAYASHTTRRSCLAVWSLAWASFGLGLVGSLVLRTTSTLADWMLLECAGVGLSAVLFVWGALLRSQPNRPPRALWVAVVAVLGWAWLAAYELPHHLVVQYPSHVLLALAAGFTAYLYRQQWRQDPYARTLGAAFSLLALQSLVAPLGAIWRELESVAYFAFALIAVAIAVGTVVENMVVRLNDRLSATELKFRGVLDSLNEAVFLMDLDSLRVLEANQAAERLTQRSSNELLGCRFLDFCPNLREEGPTVLDHQRLFKSAFRPYNKIQVQRSNGTHLECEGEVTNVQWQDSPVLLINLSEVPERRRVGENVRRAEKISALGHMIAGVAHEVNNPLSVVMGLAQLLSRRSGLDARTREDVDKMRHETERAAKIMRSVLTFAGPREPVLVPVDLNGAVQRVIESCSSELSAATIEVEQNLAAALPWTKADTEQMEQVLGNLVHNAIYALREKQGYRKITVKTEENGFLIRLTVSDNGPGISRDAVDKIFDPFFTTKPPGKGTGLGLTIANTIVEEHRGKLLVQSELGKGAHFVVELPIVPCEPRVQPAAIPSVEVARSEEPSVPDAKPRILIVDDEPGVAEVLKEVLGSGGSVVETASNGAEALQRIVGNRYNLIISDLCMPEMDGKTLYTNIRQKAPHLSSRLIFITGDTVNAESRSFLEQTGNRWLSKPFNIAEVEKLVAEALRLDSASAEVHKRN